MVEVVKDKLWRGPRPKSFKQLQEMGITRVINLQSGFEDATTESVYEHEKPSDFGITVCKFHWSNFFPPSRAQIIAALAEIDWNGKTYVHCHSGVDRTGVFCMAVRVWWGRQPFDYAYSEWVYLGRHWWFAWWKPFLKKALL